MEVRGGGGGGGGGVYLESYTREARFLTRWDQHAVEEEEEEEEVFITNGNWRGKHNSLSRLSSDCLGVPLPPV